MASLSKAVSKMIDWIGRAVKPNSSRRNALSQMRVLRLAFEVKMPV